MTKRKRSLVIRYLYGYRYKSKPFRDYIYFNFKNKKSIGYYGWERKHFKGYFGIDIKPKQNLKVRITIEELPRKTRRK